jgi:Fic family protein
MISHNLTSFLGEFMDWQTDRLQTRLSLPAEKLEEVYTLLAKIDAVKQSWKITGNLKPQIIRRLTQSVIITSTGASNRIEGNQLTDEEVEKLYRNLRIQKLRTRDQQQVGGYLESMEFVFSHFTELRITESMILHLHGQMLRHSEKDERHRGGYKFGSNRVEAKDPEGKVLGIIFDPTPPHLVAKEMQDIVSWYQWAGEENRKHPLILIANFIFEYLAIHPFQDGNGRASRLLTNLMLLQQGYQFTSLVSHEKLIEQQKADYYLALNQTQKNWKTEREDITPWLLFFLKIVHQQAELALEILLRDDREALLSENQQDILDWIRAREASAFSRRDLIGAFDLPPRTIEASVKRLLEHRFIERLGAGRATRYRRIESSGRKTD